MASSFVLMPMGGRQERLVGFEFEHDHLQILFVIVLVCVLRSGS